jgi:lipid-A-disaccharide synthase
MTRRFYVIAGEPSGDRLGGGLMRALRAERPVDFAGVGGRDMTAAGLEPLFDMAELSVMGLTEVLPRLPRLVRRIRQTARDVIAQRPDALISIDSPDFSLRVASAARRQLPDLPVIHYVAPSVWAWRPGRAAKMARHVDHVLALLPFEPPYMQAAGMSCDFVGHPAAVSPRPAPGEVAAFRARQGFAERRLLLLAPGSRQGVVRRMMPVYLDTLARLRAEDPGLGIVCPVAEGVAADVGAALATLAPPVHAVPPAAPEEERRLALAAADAALCTSGTVTLEVAALGVPTVVAYRASPLTAAIVRRLVKVDTATLVNLVTGRKAVPEFLQERCTAANLADAVGRLLADPAAAAAQRAAFDEAMAALGRDGPPPDERAARSVLGFLERRGRPASS